MKNQKLKGFIGGIVKKIIPKVQEYEYGIVASSRKVVKRVGKEVKEGNSFYNIDIWNIVAQELETKIPKGITLYYEINGYLPNESFIQKGYDYGNNPGNHSIFIYRITFTNVDGQVFEFDDKQIEEYCKHYDLRYSETFFYYGRVCDLYKFLPYDDDSTWRGLFIKELEKDYNEKNCFMCLNPVPEEGIVVRKQKLFEYEAYKLKSARFLEHETVMLDTQEFDIEESQKVTEDIEEVRPLLFFYFNIYAKRYR